MPYIPKVRIGDLRVVVPGEEPDIPALDGVIHQTKGLKDSAFSASRLSEQDYQFPSRNFKVFDVQNVATPFIGANQVVNYE